MSRVLRLLNLAPPERTLEVPGWKVRQHPFPGSDEPKSDDDLAVADADVIVCDLEPLVGWATDRAMTLGADVRERVGVGGVLITFAGKPKAGARPSGQNANNYSWLFQDLVGARDKAGSRIEVSVGSALETLLREFLPGLRWPCDFDLNSVPQKCFWSPLALNQFKRPVAAIAQYGQGQIILLPRVEQADEFLAKLITQVLPQVSPQLELPQVTAETAPEWAPPFLSAIPDVGPLTEKIAETESKIKSLQDTVTQDRGQLVNLQKWARLLWETGPALEALVRDALRTLGVPNDKTGLVDTVANVSGRECYIEIEGSVQGTKIDKARQLMQYVAEAPNPAEISGAIIANPYRLEPPDPDHRPPDANHKLFAKEVKDMAAKYGWALVTTTELFELVKKKLAGDNSAGETLKNRLFSGQPRPP